jgi:NRPS condensation-like uncharacterized protein
MRCWIALDKISEDDFHKQTALKLLNHRQDRETVPPIEFHLIQSASRNTFLMRWIHPFCDAKGADLILKYLCTDAAEQRLRFDLPRLGIHTLQCAHQAANIIQTARC